jgi:hypothetical protein
LVSPAAAVAVVFAVTLTRVSRSELLWKKNSQRRKVMLHALPLGWILKKSVDFHSELADLFKTCPVLRELLDRRIVKEFFASPNVSLTRRRAKTSTKSARHLWKLL